MEKKPYHHKNLKMDLIEKGIELVNKEGVANLSIRKLASECGVTHAAPYSYFKKKEELLDAMQKHITNQFSVILESVIQEHEEDPQLLKYMGISYVIFFIKNPQYFSFLYSQTNMHINLSIEADAETNYRPFEIFREVITSIMDKEGCSGVQKNDVVIAMWAFVHGIASIATMPNVEYNQDWVKKVGDFLDIFSFFQNRSV